MLSLYNVYDLKSMYSAHERYRVTLEKYVVHFLVAKSFMFINIKGIYIKEDDTDCLVCPLATPLCMIFFL